MKWDNSIFFLGVLDRIFSDRQNRDRYFSQLGTYCKNLKEEKNNYAYENDYIYVTVRVYAKGLFPCDRKLKQHGITDRFSDFPQSVKWPNWPFFRYATIP